MYSYPIILSLSSLSFTSEIFTLYGSRRLTSGGWIYLFLTGKRTSGVETQGAPIWWRQFRIVHGLLYLLFAFYAIQRVATAYQILLADVSFGLVIFLWHHYTTGSFTQLFK